MSDSLTQVWVDLIKELRRGGLEGFKKEFKNQPLIGKGIWILGLVFVVLYPLIFVVLIIFFVSLFVSLIQDFKWIPFAFLVVTLAVLVFIVGEFYEIIRRR